MPCSIDEMYNHVSPKNGDPAPLVSEEVYKIIMDVSRLHIVHVCWPWFDGHSSGTSTYFSCVCCQQRTDVSLHASVHFCTLCHHAAP